MIAQLKAALGSFRVYRAARFGWHFATDPIFRRDHRLLWRGSENLFQHRSITAFDRYPEIFGFVRDHLRGCPNPRLLSFGCATGEEVFSLRAYFPRATIKGVDINAANIASCLEAQRVRGGDPAMVFVEGSSVAGEPAGSYDAVFCMAVFVRWQLRENHSITTCAPHLKFADYERAAGQLAACVRPGGLLVLRHAMFRFSDTVASKAFEQVLEAPESGEFFPRFGRDDNRLPALESEAVVFRKKSAA